MIDTVGWLTRRKGKEIKVVALLGNALTEISVPQPCGLGEARGRCEASRVGRRGCEPQPSSSSFWFITVPFPLTAPTVRLSSHSRSFRPSDRGQKLISAMVLEAGYPNTTGFRKVVKATILIKKKAGLSDADFIEHYNHKHAQMAAPVLEKHNCLTYSLVDLPPPPARATIKHSP